MTSTVYIYIYAYAGSTSFENVLQCHLQVRDVMIRRRRTRQIEALHVLLQQRPISDGVHFMTEGSECDTSEGADDFVVASN